jgi:hypothetical protein
MLANLLRRRITLTDRREKLKSIPKNKPLISALELIICDKQQNF